VTGDGVFKEGGWGAGEANIKQANEASVETSEEEKEGKGEEQSRGSDIEHGCQEID